MIESEDRVTMGLGVAVLWICLGLCFYVCICDCLYHLSLTLRMRWERGAWDPGNHGVGADIDPPPGFPSFLPPLVTVGVRKRRLTSPGWTKHWLHLGLLLRSPYYYWSFGASMWLKEPFLGGDWELCDLGEWIKPIWTWNWSETKTGPIGISWNFHWRVTSPCWPCSIASSSLIFSSTRSPSFSALRASSSS